MYVPDWFVAQELVKTLHDDDCNDNDLVEWYNCYKNCKTWKKRYKQRAVTYSIAPLLIQRLVDDRGWEEKE